MGEIFIFKISEMNSCDNSDVMDLYDSGESCFSTIDCKGEITQLNKKTNVMQSCEPARILLNQKEPPP